MWFLQATTAPSAITTACCARWKTTGAWAVLAVTTQPPLGTRCLSQPLVPPGWPSLVWATHTFQFGPALDRPLSLRTISIRDSPARESGWVLAGRSRNLFHSFDVVHQQDLFAGMHHPNPRVERQASRGKALVTVDQPSKARSLPVASFASVGRAVATVLCQCVVAVSASANSAQRHNLLANATGTGQRALTPRGLGGASAGLWFDHFMIVIFENLGYTKAIANPSFAK